MVRDLHIVKTKGQLSHLNLFAIFDTVEHSFLLKMAFNWLPGKYSLFYWLTFQPHKSYSAVFAGSSLSSSNSWNVLEP